MPCYFTRVHSNQDLLWRVIIGVYMGYCVHRGSSLLSSSVLHTPAKYVSGGCILVLRVIFALCLVLFRTISYIVHMHLYAPVVGPAPLAQRCRVFFFDSLDRHCGWLLPPSNFFLVVDAELFVRTPTYTQRYRTTEPGPLFIYYFSSLLESKVINENRGPYTELYTTRAPRLQQFRKSNKKQ